MSDQRGFSVIELVIALVLMGLMAAIVAPSFASAIDRDHTMRAADRFLADVNFARMVAVRAGEPVRIDFRADGDGYDVVLVTPGGDQVERQTRFDRSYGNAAFAGPPAPVIFNSRGMLRTDDDVSLVLEGGDGTRIRFTGSAAGRFLQTID